MTRPSERPSSRSALSYCPQQGEHDERLIELLRRQPFAGEAEYGCYRIHDNSDYSNIARTVECTVFNEAFGNAPTIMSEAYGRYESHSDFFLIVDRELQRPAGVMRVIGASKHGLKTLNDIEEPPLSISIADAMLHHQMLDLNECWDVATLAVLKRYRSRTASNTISIALYGLLYAECLTNDIEHVVMIVDDRAYTQMTKVLGLPFEPILDSSCFSYLGSASSRAVCLHTQQVRSAVEAHAQRLDPSRHKWLHPMIELFFDAPSVFPICRV